MFLRKLWYVRNPTGLLPSAKDGSMKTAARNAAAAAASLCRLPGRGRGRRGRHSSFIFLGFFSPISAVASSSSRLKLNRTHECFIAKEFDHSAAPANRKSLSLPKKKSVSAYFSDMWPR